MTDITLKIDGMSCQHCVMNVRKALESIDGIEASDVSVGSANITYDESKTDKDTIVKSVQNAGYTIVT